ncbi:hypothetical protein [Sphingomonas mollis]|uniref:Uncharacterized protein n=1 Tax=Sphingomonas mollis TaxID=2795726 RepID=A0ABS0XMW4_9SPHN|nr:hypothetical protein [Sphingomonas sp. BT553]MBJ6121374.1 hypothetical protein [Sphingomonas sp. BT553]
MNIVHQSALIRGRAIVDYALSRETHDQPFAVRDMIGIVAAYVGSGRPWTTMEQDLTDLLDPALGKRAAETLSYFDFAQDRGLWVRSSNGDFRFTNHALQKNYPANRLSDDTHTIG